MNYSALGQEGDTYTIETYNKLGEGSNGSVYTCRNVFGRTYAIKIIKLKDTTKEKIK